ncbi:unnamed protein product, partial [Onchocerca flexuosa]|uniref:X-box-binding protein 1 n=1 Tax=Onchocerca flexuosa TaxID=387005 RepID=A0A183HQS4_9BILA
MWGIYVCVCVHACVHVSTCIWTDWLWIAGLQLHWQSMKLCDFPGNFDHFTKSPMSLYILHPQTVTTPNYSTSFTKTRNTSAPILPRYCSTARPVTVHDRQIPSLRTVIPVQNVQRSEKSTVLQQPIEELLGLSAPSEHPVRKRECLNHLTAEEKQNRRKLKNRVAAQTARDRKKYRATKLEEAVRTLVLENRKLREEN